jgi:hypothetical protein
MKGGKLSGAGIIRLQENYPAKIAANAVNTVQTMSATHIIPCFD